MDRAAERAKLSEHAHYFHMVVHGLAFDHEAGEAQTPKLDIIFGQNFVITAHHEPLPWLEALWAEAPHPDADDELLSRGMPLLLDALLDALVDSYFPVLDELDDVIDELEDQTVNSASNQVQVRIFHLKRSLVQMRRVISPQIEVANLLVARAGRFIPPA